MIEAASGRLVDANPRALERLGLDRDQMLARDLGTLASEPIEIVEGWLARVRRSGGGVFECGLRTRTGAVVPVEVSARSLAEEGVVLLVGRETGARRSVERILQARVDLLRDVIDAVGGPIVVTDLDGVVTLVNRAARALLPEDGAVLLGRPLDEAGFWPDSEGIRKRVRTTIRAAAAGSTHRCDERIRTPDGGTRQIDFSFRPVTDLDDEPSQIVVSGIDVTERERLRTGELATGAAGPGLTGEGRIDRDGTWTAAARTLGELLGRAPEDLIGRQVWELLDRDQAASVRQQFDRLLENSVPFVATRLGAPGGAHLDLVISPHRGSADGFEVLLRQEEASEVDPTIVTAGQIDPMKTGLLARVSHEIRTPMNAIIGLTALSLEEELPEGVRRQLRVALGSARQLMRLLDDLLGFSAAESSDLAIEPEPFSPRRMIERVMAMHGQRAAEKGLEFGWTCRGELPETLLGDELRVSQIVTNLVANAIKFTERGRVTVTLATRELDEGEVELLIEVTDTGPGIVPEIRERIFRPFKQGDGSRGQVGVGLGLAIVKGLAERMDGAVVVTSEPGRGSSFRVNLKLEPCTERPASIAASTSGETTRAASSRRRERLRILAIDDTHANRMLIEAVLGKRGHEVRCVGSAVTGVDLLDSEQFDVVLMDVSMPDMDGLEATKLIRERERAFGRPAVPIIAVTAHAAKGDRESCIGAGMNGYLSKPIHVTELATLVESSVARLPVTRSQDDDPVAAVVAPDRALRRLDGDRGLYRRMAEILDEEAPMLVASIADNLASDPTTAGRAAHTLKGELATVGGESGARLAARLESLIRDGRADEAGQVLSLLRADIRSTLAQIRRHAAEA